mmetsp:Transcript_67445/g.60583  ORF Transcript_67445/g.60583 Transcript_67445/m.60583 type:complete len:470 (+) Transcript_67445:27-1436(+)|eukprot:CAMPEP_0201582028 /NCGR_PEP_ID=MMETSP0190_2-20130828/79167_1 /ASSEMBLY_ACC=CAM_ASM_000263 /TAXON_ID=37353 /ORGANISM="Rosalina sp." /LENGTH=469 /DNA_ID=CAMNT_0048021155 /DNA_START=27 /DNA_END=1436 /DNA_ORIENTATION=+
MGQVCSACSDDDKHRYTGDDKDPSNRTMEGNVSNISKQKMRAQSMSGKNMNEYDDDSSDDDYGYDGSTSRDDEDSKSVSSKALDDHDIEVAYDGWKKAIESGNETLATFYFEEYPNIDMFQFRWDNGDSALHMACKAKKARLVFFLLTQGATVNEQNINDGNTALHLATANRDEKVVDLLLKWDADPNVTNKSQETPITISSQWRDQTIYRMLAGIKEDDMYINDNNNKNPTLNRLTTNADRFAALQVTAQMLAKEDSTDANIDDVLGNIAEDNNDDNNNEYEERQTYEERQRRETESKQQTARKTSEVALRANQIARSNPFTGFGRRPTALAHKIVKDHLKQKPLPKLEAWLEKRKPGGVVPTYQKRWIIVKGAHMLWSSKQRAIKNDADRNERKKFNGSIHLMTIEAIQPIETNANNKFMVKAKDAKKGSMREYVFRCTNKRERDFWVQGLKEHKKQYQTVLSYLGK